MNKLPALGARRAPQLGERDRRHAAGASRRIVASEGSIPRFDRPHRVICRQVMPGQPRR
jgi:hypothetical protein